MTAPGDSRARVALPKRNKYGAVKTVVDGITFDSKLEARQYAELKLREKAGEITALRYQTPFTLTVDGTAIGKYIADFYYREGWRYVVQEAKGKMTPLAAWKLKHARAEYKNVEFRVVKKGGRR